MAIDDISPLELVQTIKANCHMLKFKDGLEQAAMASISKAKNREDLIVALRRTFDAYRVSINPNWDGSIA